MQGFLLFVHVVIAAVLVVFVLLQRSEGGALGIGGGGGGFMSTRGSANFMTRATAGLATAFIITSLTLAILAGSGKPKRSILETPAQPAPTAPAKPAGPAVPLAK